METLVPREISDELNLIQQDFFSRGKPVLILFEGSSGRVISRTITELIRCLEPRGVSYHHFDPKDASPRTLFDYLHCTPAKGEFSLFDRSWYSMVVDRYKGDKGTFDSMVKSCIGLERYLRDSGMLIIKILLRASPEDVNKYADDYCPSLCYNNTFLSVDKIDPVKFRATMDGEGLLKATDTDCGPWDVVNVKDPGKTVLEVVEIVRKRLKAGILDDCKPKKRKIEESYPNPRKDLDLDVKLPDSESLEEISERLYELQSVLAASNRSLVIGFEGWDASGKGSAIKHLAYAFNPKGYVVKQVKTPTDYENAHPYLWRFCDSMPRAGHITIFDRTWYGRMMVEPIEGFCTQDEYDRSASEINAMEFNMVQQGTIVIKFWLDISSEEQLKRFNKRSSDELKQWKLTDEDWRNRDKWDTYAEHVDRMIASTNTPEAPWTIIPANDKKYARFQVINTVVEKLRSELVEKKYSGLL